MAKHSRGLVYAFIIVEKPVEPFRTFKRQNTRGINEDGCLNCDYFLAGAEKKVRATIQLQLSLFNGIYTN